MNKINKKDLIGIATLVMSAVGIVLGFFANCEVERTVLRSKTDAERCERTD